MGSGGPTAAVCDTGRYRMPYFVWGSGPPDRVHPRPGRHEPGVHSGDGRPAAGVHLHRLRTAGGRPGRRPDRGVSASSTSSPTWSPCSTICGCPHARTCSARRSGRRSCWPRCTIIRTGRCGRCSRAAFAYRACWPRERGSCATSPAIGRARLRPCRLRARLDHPADRGVFRAIPEEFWFHRANSDCLPKAAVARRGLMVPTVDLRPMLPAIRQPVLLICGDSDRIVPAACEQAAHGGTAERRPSRISELRSLSALHARPAGGRGDSAIPGGADLPDRAGVAARPGAAIRFTPPQTHSGSP